MPSAASASAAREVSSERTSLSGDDERPGRLQHAVEVALRAQGLLDLVEVADRGAAEHAAVLLVEAAQQAHAEALAAERRRPVLARVGEQLAHVALRARR